MTCPEATWEAEAVGRQPCCLTDSDHSSELSQRFHQPGLLPASRATREGEHTRNFGDPSSPIQDSTVPRPWPDFPFQIQKATAPVFSSPVTVGKVNDSLPDLWF